MKKTILFITLFITAITVAQNSLFDNISTTDQYEQYVIVQDDDGDGVYERTGNYSGSKPTLVKFEKKHLSTGEGFQLKIVIASGKRIGEVLHNSNAVDGYYLCSGYPFETSIKHKYDKDGYVSIGDYVFLLKGISADGTSFKSIDNVYIKKGTTTSEPKSKKKKKVSFFKKLKALKNKTKSGNYGPLHKAFISKNINKIITDYLEEMKVKQDNRTVKEKQKDKNIIKAKGKANDDIKKYNDSIKATPKYKKMKAHQARMRNMDKNNAKTSVTIYNRTGKDIYIYKEGSRNGTRVNVNSSVKINCSSNYTYKFNSNSNGTGAKCYNSNTGCGKSVTIK